MMVACQLNMSSPVGPAEQFAGGSFPRSVNSFVIRFSAMATAFVYQRILLCQPLLRHTRVNRHIDMARRMMRKATC